MPSPGLRFREGAPFPASRGEVTRGASLHHFTSKQTGAVALGASPRMVR